jgi:peptidoglycan-N-acetylglucosamine deacetylase
MLTMHPEVSGRPHRIALLDRLIRHIRQRPDVWWATGEQVARHCAPLLAEA